MTIANATETAIMKLIYQATSWTNYATSTGDTNIAVALHLSDPGEGGDATTGEATYTPYARVNVVRTTGGWTENAGVITPVASIDFAQGTSGSGTIQFFSTSHSNASPPTGAQAILWSGGVSPTIASGNGVLPRLTTSTTISLD